MRPEASRAPGGVPAPNGRRASRERRRGPCGRGSLLPAVALAALLCGLAGGCERPPRRGAGMDDSTWVEAMARLYVAPRELEAAGRGAVGPGAEDSARAAVLAELGIAPDSLLRFAEAAGADPARMASLWEAVAARVEELGGPPAEAARRAGRGAPRETGGAAPAPHRAAPPPGAAPRRQIVTPEPEPGVRPPPGRRAPAAVPGDAGARPGERAPAGEARPRPARMPAATERDTSDLQERLRRVRERAAADSA